MEIRLNSRVKASGPGLTILDAYESDSKAVDKVLKAADTPLDEKNLKPTVSNSTIGASNDERPQNGRGILSVQGLNTLFNSPEDITGTESFLDTVKQGAEELLRLIKSFGLWLFELVANRVKRLRIRINRLNERNRGRGIKLIGPVEYPKTIHALNSLPAIPKNPEWILKALSAGEAFYDKIMLGQTELEKSIVALPSDVDRKQTLNLADHVARTHAKIVLGQSTASPSPVVLRSANVLPGSRKYVVLAGGQSGFTFSSSHMENVPLKRGKLIGFTPDQYSVNNILKQCGEWITKIEGTHKSQTSMSRAYEAKINGLKRATNKDNATAAKAAYQYYAWLIGFQQKSLNRPLVYCFTLINAALDFCDSAIK